jgi:hypothetical protein
LLVMEGFWVWVGKFIAVVISCFIILLLGLLLLICYYHYV